MNVPEVFSKSSNLKISYTLANKKYTITGTSNVKEKLIKIGNREFITKTIELRLGLSEDAWPCIVLIYHYYPGNNVFEVMGIVSKDYNNDGNPKTLTCLNPPLPDKGALDILVMTALGIAKYIDPIARVFIDDKASLDGVSLSWLKYFEKYETTYSKYGFIMRGDTVDDAVSYPIFENFMKVQLGDVLQMKLKDLYNKTILDKINESYEKIGEVLSTSHTLENTIKLFLRAKKSGHITRYLDKGKYDFINLEGVWELSWYYYDNNISEDKKIHDIHVARI